MDRSRLLARLGLVFMLAVIAVACGRKGDLDTPYEAAVEARRAAEEEGRTPLPPEPEPPRERRFLLDPLIE
jgi:predicted small lipoprotein YifL